MQLDSLKIFTYHFLVGCLTTYSSLQTNSHFGGIYLIKGAGSFQKEGIRWPTATGSFPCLLPSIPQNPVFPPSMGPIPIANILVSVEPPRTTAICATSPPFYGKWQCVTAMWHSHCHKGPCAEGTSVPEGHGPKRGPNSPFPNTKDNISGRFSGFTFQVN